MHNLLLFIIALMLLACPSKPKRRAPAPPVTYTDEARTKEIEVDTTRKGRTGKTQEITADTLLKDVKIIAEGWLENDAKCRIGGEYFTINSDRFSGVNEEYNFPEDKGNDKLEEHFHMVYCELLQKDVDKKNLAVTHFPYKNFCATYSTVTYTELEKCTEQDEYILITFAPKDQ